MIDENNPFSMQGQSDDQSWALEETQAEMLENIKEYVTKNAHKDTAALRKIAVNTTKSLNKDAKEEDILKALDAEAKASNQTRNKNLTGMSKSINKGNDMARSDAMATLKGMKANASGHLRALSGKGGGFIKTIGTFDGDVGKMSETIAGAVPILGGVLGASVGTIASINKTWQGLSSVGLGFGQDMFAMRTQLMDSGLGFEGATKYLTEFSGVANALGSKDMLDLQKNVRKTSMEFGNYGLTVSQVANITGSLAEQEMNRGNFAALKDGKQAARTDEYMKTLRTLSTLTGRQVEELDKEQRARSTNISKEQAYMRILATKGQEAADKFKADATKMELQTAVLGAKGQETAMTAFYNSASGLTTAMDENARTYQSAGVDIEGATRAIVEAESPEAKKKATDNYIKMMLDSGQQIAGMVGVMSIGGDNPAANALTEMSIEFRGVSARINENGDGLADAIGSIRDALTTVTAENKATIDYNKKMEQFRMTTGEWMAKFSNGLRDMTGNFLNSLGPWIERAKALFEKLGISVEGVTGAINTVLGGWGKWAIAIIVGTVGILGLFKAAGLLRLGFLALRGGIKGFGSLLKKLKGPGKPGSALKQAKAAKAKAALKTAKAGKLAALGQKAGTVGKIAGKASAGLGVALVAGGIVKDLADISGSMKRGERVKSEDKYAAGGATTGAVIGGVLGLVAGPLGAAVGAGIGGMIGDYVGTKIGKAKDAKHAASIAAAAPTSPTPEVTPEVDANTLNNNKFEEAKARRKKALAESEKKLQQTKDDIAMKGRSGREVSMDDTKLLQEIQKSGIETNMLLRFIVDSSGQTAVSAKRNEQDLLKGNDTM